MGSARKSVKIKIPSTCITRTTLDRQQPPQLAAVEIKSTQTDTVINLATVLC